MRKKSQSTRIELSWRRKEVNDSRCGDEQCNKPISFHERIFFIVLIWCVCRTLIGNHKKIRKRWREYEWPFSKFLIKIAMAHTLKLGPLCNSINCIKIILVTSVSVWVCVSSISAYNMHYMHKQLIESRITAANNKFILRIRARKKANKQRE